MFKRILMWVVIGAIVGGLTWYIVARLLTSDEDRVRNVIAGLIANAESDAGNFAVYRIQTQLAESFEHHDGKSTYPKAVIIRALAGLMSQYTNVKVKVDELFVVVKGDTAEVTLTGRVTAAPVAAPGGLVELMTRPGHNRVLIILHKIDGDWLVTRSELIAHELPSGAPVAR